ncbi:xerD [Symbiodinium sp. CCMP2592]|nr:xerD [Symbiodinium sp. CCMP2592]
MSPELLSLLQQAFRSPRRTASPSALIMAEAAPPTGMGNRQLREWIQEWGSAWDFLGLAPGSAMSEVLRAYKRTAIRLHPDKSPPEEVEMATAPPPKAPPPSSSSSSAPPPPGKGAGKASPPPGRGSGPSSSAKGKDKGRWGTPFYDTSSDEFSSAGPDTESSGPEIDRYPRIRCGRVLRCCNQCGHHQYAWCMRCGWVRHHRRWRHERRPSEHKGPPYGYRRQQKGASKGPYGDSAPGTLQEERGPNMTENLLADLKPVDAEEPEKLGSSSAGAPPRANPWAPPQERIPTKAPPPSTFNNTMRWICGGCGEPNGLHRYGCNGCGRSQHAVGNVQEKATHWICPDCNQCSGCGCWRPRHGSLINNGPAPDDLLVHPRASTAPPPSSATTAPSSQPSPPPKPKSVYFAKKVLGKARAWAHRQKDLYHIPRLHQRATPRQTSRMCTAGGLQPVIDPPQGPAPKKARARGPAEENRPMVVVPNGEALWFTVRELDETTPRLVLPWTLFQHVVMCRRALCGLQSWGRVGVVFIRRVAQDILYWARRRGHMSRIHIANQNNPCFMDLQAAHPEPQGDLPPLSPATGDHRPLFTFQDFLRNPSLGQHYRGNEGPPRPGRTALPCIYATPLRRLLLAETYAEADNAQNVMGRWAMQILGDEPAVPPDEGAPPADGGKGDSAPSSTPSGKGSGNTVKRATHWYCKRCSYGAPITRSICTMCNRNKEQCVVSDDEEAEDDVALNEEELEEVARLERECAELEHWSQKGKGGSSNVKVRASNDTARKDPKYLADLDAGVPLTVAFQRHRSRLRAVQHQVAQGNVALQPRSTPMQTVRALPPMMSLGRSHRLYLLNRLERLERHYSEHLDGNLFCPVGYNRGRVKLQVIPPQLEPICLLMIQQGVPPEWGPEAPMYSGRRGDPPLFVLQVVCELKQSLRQRTTTDG